MKIDVDEIFGEYEELVFNLDNEEFTESELEYLNSLTDEELKELSKELEDNGDYYDSLQMGQKLILNSIYGAFGNEYFVCSDTNIAGGITAMGRHLIKFVDKINEEYWYNYWHIDYELHEKLGLNSENIKPIDPAWIHRESKTLWEDEVTDELVENGTIQRKYPTSVYIDTDSVFVSFEQGFKSCGWKGDRMEFVMKICKERLEPLFDSKLNKLAKEFKVKNLQKFELENVSESVIFLTKKKYVKHVLWEDGRTYGRLDNIAPKGVDLIKKGTPVFAREKVLDIITYIFDNYEMYFKNKNAMLKQLLKFVKQLRKEIEVTDINEITKITSVNAYHSNKIMVDNALMDGPGIINDKEELVWAKNTYYMIKAAGLYNHILYKETKNDQEILNKYDYIRPGDRVKYYDCIDDRNKVFCFIYGKYPMEFAPPIDYDVVFLKTISKQVNFYLEALELPELNKRLSIVMSIF